MVKIVTVDLFDKNTFKVKLAMCHSHDHLLPLTVNFNGMDIIKPLK